MGKVIFYLFVIPVSRSPHFILYRISDILFLIVYYLIGYRKKVVFENLENSFPDKDEKEIRRIARKFYQHLCDLIVEACKMFTISEAEMIKRCKVRNPEVLQTYYDQGKSIIVPAGHYNNWEMAATASNIQMPHQTAGAYTPIKDPFILQKVTQSRSAFGLIMVPLLKLNKFFETYQGPPMAMLFGCDQSPRNVKTAYWTHFLNQETGVMIGTEKFAKKYDYPVFYGRIEKVKRGFYEFEFILVEDQPLSSEPGAITEKHTRLLEQDILEKPEYWLWSHRRWKRKRNPVEV